MLYEAIKKDESFFLIAGPCVTENEQMAFDIAGEVKRICNKYDLKYIFKASYRKANRSRLDSFTGIGDTKALEIIKNVGEHFNIPVTTDIHSVEEAGMAAQYVDVLQIPAFLSRQTDILVAAAKTGKMVNIKKGQFLSPSSMVFAIDKVRQSGNVKVIATDRGTMFGYGDLIVDFRGIPQMKKFNVPVVMDCTHSLQKPNTTSGVTGGDPEMIETIAKAAIAVGADGLFIETHPNPSIAKSDGANMLKLDKLEGLIQKLVKIKEALK
ncbi:MAG TPA: 3-deoxy-8-phosphooctulonate synthase [Bacteroidetes bacterium]|nr:3-deoxy-8-phosphooctulonate synthase [Bacteroidota bacterium]